MPISSPGKFKTTAVGNSFGGDGAALANIGEFNVFVGNGSGANNIADFNTFVGANGSQDNTGERNTFIGHGISAQNDGDNNTVVGANSFGNSQALVPVNNITVLGSGILNGLGSPTQSRDVVAIGNDIGTPLTGAQIMNRCVFIGQNVGDPSHVTYEDTISIGYNSAPGVDDVVIGAYASESLSPNSGDARNVIIGKEAAQFSTRHTDNVFIGYQAGWQNFNPALPNQFNVCIGRGAGTNMSASQNNTYVGRSTGLGNGSNNTMLGQNLGGNGSGNVFIGEGIVENISDALRIEGEKSPPASPGLITGEFINENVGINTDDYGGGKGAFGIKDAVTLPTTNPVGGGVLYVENGALKWLGPSGAITLVGDA